MCDNKNHKWMCVAVIAAVVAALTTAAVFLLRAKAKRKALQAYNDSFDCDLGDCCCDDCCCSDDEMDENPNE